jgi:low temperature requirement protein LtrA
MGVEETRVSTLELFFDLVFVFTVTQLTTVLVDHPNGDGLAQVMVMLAAIWWMYAGYSWLTNVIDVGITAHRGFLLAAMAAYLVLALAVPGAFSGSGFAFGLAYLLIIVVHSALFSHSISGRSARAFLRVAPTNVIFAVTIVVGGALGGDAQWVIWPLSAVGLWLVPELRRASSGGFELTPSHFVERHGLVIIVALGESVVAIGIGAAGLPVDLDLVIVAVLGLALSAGLWWTYFSDEDDVQRAFREAGHAERGRIGVEGFGYCHWLLLLGIVLVAAGLKKATPHPFDAASAAACAGLGGGVALFLVGDLLFRARLGLAGGRGRALAAAASLATIQLGLVVAELQVGVLVALLAALVVSRLPLRPAARAPRPASPPAQPR